MLVFRGLSPIIPGGGFCHDSPRNSRSHRHARLASLTLQAGSTPARAKLGMVITQNDVASQIGFNVIKSGGNAVDAAVATAFALAVTHPTAGNIGGGGFIVYRPATGEPVSFDFREIGPAALVSGDVAEGRQIRLRDSSQQPPLGRRARNRGRPVPGVEGTGVQAWKDLLIAGDRPRPRRLRDHARPGPLARVDDPGFKKYPASLAQFSKNGQPYEAGETLKQPDLAKTLTRIAEQGPAGFYEGETAHAHRKGDEGQRWPHHHGRSQGLPGQEARRDQGHVSRLRDHRHAAAELGRHRGGRDAEHPRRLRPQEPGLRIAAQGLHYVTEVDAARLRRPRALPRRSGLQRRHADADADLQGLRHHAAEDDQPEEGVEVARSGSFAWPTESLRDHAPLDRRRQAQRGVDDLHARIRLRLAHRRARRRLPAQQRDG